MIQNKEPNDDHILVSFVDLYFGPEDENIPDKLIMSGKQFKIINSKINSLLQIQADTGEKKYELKSKGNTRLKLKNLVYET